MTKAKIDQLIKYLQAKKLLGQIGKWQMEALEDSEYHVRYVGVTLPADWQNIISTKNNFLLKFLVNRQKATLEYYLANKSPFILFWQIGIKPETDWKDILGPLKQKLNKDKKEFIANEVKIDNLFVKIKSQLKK